MPNHDSTRKSLKKNEKRHLRNVSEKSKIRTLVKKVRTAATDKDVDSAKSGLLAAVSALDKAAKKHVIHPRNASRRKSRLMHLVATLEKKA